MKLFGYSISLNVLILIGILYLIMAVNALSGACNREGLNGPAGKAARRQRYPDQDHRMFPQQDQASKQRRAQQKKDEHEQFRQAQAAQAEQAAYK